MRAGRAIPPSRSLKVPHLRTLAAGGVGLFSYLGSRRSWVKDRLCYSRVRLLDLRLSLHLRYPRVLMALPPKRSTTSE